VFPSVLLSRPALAVLTLLVVAAAAEWLPELAFLRVLSPRQSTAALTQSLVPEREPERMPPSGEVELEEETSERPELAQPERPADTRIAPGPIAGQGGAEVELRVDVDEPPVALVDADALAPFYRALARSEAKVPGAVTRILYHGDSVVASDYVTGTLRRKLQEQFGDSGHGFVLLANAWPSYFHNDVFRTATKGWNVSRVVGPFAPDGLYGLGGVSFRGYPGMRARFGTAKSGRFGRSVASFEIAYLAQPGGGELGVLVDGQERARIVTDAPRTTSAFQRIEVPDGEHVLELIVQRGSVRAFGVVLERDEPGVVLDAIGVQGARIRFLDKQDDEHWAEQLAHRAPDLLVFHFGANESADGVAYSMVDYHRTMKDVLLQARSALPGASCLILAAMDRARKEDAGVVTVPAIPRIVLEQRKTAAELGCAFWDTYQAMGGRGAMARWVKRGLAQADLTHPSAEGAELLGSWLYLALLQGYRAHLAGAGLASDALPR
jgi:GDSL-like lipase/acylhydrolase family protein